MGVPAPWNPAASSAAGESSFSPRPHDRGAFARLWTPDDQACVAVDLHRRFRPWRRAKGVPALVQSVTNRAPIGCRHRIAAGPRHAAEHSTNKRLDNAVDLSTRWRMADTPSDKTRQIVGFSISPELATQVKTEAAQRGLSLRRLFEEMWSTYEKARAKAES